MPPLIPHLIPLSPVQIKRDSYVEVRSSTVMLSKQNIPTPVKNFKDSFFERESEDFAEANLLPSSFTNALELMKRPGSTKRISH